MTAKMDKTGMTVGIAELDAQYSPYGHQTYSTDSPLLSPGSDRQSVGFARAALAFTDKLGSIRRKRESGHTFATTPTTEVSEASADTAPQKSIKVLRMIQSSLTALLSLAIAFMQGRVYIMYLRTKDVKGAWPRTPQLVPTILLFSVAVAAFTFDIAMLSAYLAPGKRLSRKCFSIASGAYGVVTSAKTIAYALTSIVCRAGFNFGNASDTHMDLWSWTCTAKAAEMASVNQAPSNCETQVSTLQQESNHLLTSP